MSSHSASLVSSSSRPLQLRMRSDLVVERQSYQGRLYYLVKDPLGLKYYRFEEEEFAILEMLSGPISLDRIQSQFDFRLRRGATGRAHNPVSDAQGSWSPIPGRLRAGIGS